MYSGQQTLQFRAAPALFFPQCIRIPLFYTNLVLLQCIAFLYHLPRSPITFLVLHLLLGILQLVSLSMVLCGTHMCRAPRQSCFPKPRHGIISVKLLTSPHLIAHGCCFSCLSMYLVSFALHLHIDTIRRAYNPPLYLFPVRPKPFHYRHLLFCAGDHLDSRRSSEMPPIQSAEWLEATVSTFG